MLLLQFLQTPLGVALVTALLAFIAFVWRIHVKSQLNKKEIEAHKETCDARAESMRSTMEDTFSLVSNMANRFDGLKDKMHDTQLTLVAHVNKEEGALDNVRNDIRDLDKKVDGFHDKLDKRVTVLEDRVNGISKAS